MRITSKTPFSLSLRVGDSTPSQASQPQPNKISPAVLFIIVILAVIFFISGLLHLLLRLLTRKQSDPDPDPNPNPDPPPPPPNTTQRQLQQLFHFHDSGLDQTIIDSLPIFLYQDILLGPKDPFDCAVCLSEFLNQDQLRLLPDCGHAFHLHCIDTWLLSNSTCPLCRASLALLIDNTDYLFGDALQEDARSQYPPHHGKLQEEDKILYSIKLGKFTSLSKPENVTDANQQNGNVHEEIGNTSSSNLDARRCFSMGSYQYILANSTLQVPCTSVRGKSMRFVGSTTRNEAPNEWKINAGTRGESLSVSKIWQRPAQKGVFGGNSSSQGNSILVRLPVM